MIKRNVDYKLFFAVIALIIFWMIMISSVSVFPSFKVTSGMVAKWYIQEAYNHFYVIRNIAHVIIWLIAVAVISKIRYTFFEKFSHYTFWLSLLLLFIVLVIWSVFWWAKWWLDIPWVPFLIQPTEFMKIALIVFLAAIFKKYKWYLQSFQYWFLPYLGIIWFIVLLVGLQPDFGTILVVVPVSALMFFYAWANIKHLWITALLWFLLIFSVYITWDYDKETWETTKWLWYITQRLDTFLWDNEDLFTAAAYKDERKDQIRQALITIWSWGFTWLGFGHSIQKYWFLPAVEGDFIFSVIIEELWFLWWMTLIFIYLYIWYRALYISRHSKDLFAKYFALWYWSRILFQAFVNIWVNLNIMPLTGITLPFISYWWSSLLSLLIWLWILLNISRYIDDKPKYSRLARKKIMF
jgi:cell division protein FtsW